MKVTQIESYLKVRDPIEMRIGGGGMVRVFTVRIQNIAPEGIYIDRPVIDPVITSFGVAKDVEIQFGKDRDTYRFATQIIGEKSVNQLPLLLLRRPTVINRLPRRKHPRINIDIPITFQLLTSAAKETIGQYRRGTIIDVSAGGVKFWAPPQQTFGLIPGITILVNFSLSRNVGVVEVKSLALKVEPNPRERSRTLVVCRFLNISKKTQEAIVQHNIRYKQLYRVEPGR